MILRSERRVRAYKTGVKAERYAALYLRLKGYRIIKQRYKTPVGEVDIIAQRGEALVFIEVKAHKETDMSLYAVNERAQRRIEKAAGHFVIYHPDYAGLNMRFDVMVVAPGFAGGIFPKHLDNAWEAHS